MAYYNDSYMDTSNTFLDIYQGVNAIKADLFGGLALAVLFIIALSILSKNKTEDAFLLSSFLTAFVSVLMFAFHSITLVPMVIALLLLFGSIIAKVW